MSTVTAPSNARVFRCEQCGMQIKVSGQRQRDEAEPQFICCGRPLRLLNRNDMVRRD